MCASIKDHLEINTDNKSKAILDTIKVYKENNIKYPEYFGCIPHGELAHNRFIKYSKDKGETPTVLSTATRHHLYDEVLYNTD